MDIFGGKNDNNNIYEYVTLVCQKFPTDTTTIAATIHLKVQFYDNIDDNQSIAIEVSAVIVVADTTVPTTTNLNGMYEGYVRKDQVASSSQYLYDKVTAQSTTTGNNELVRAWLQEARSALTGYVSSDNCNAAKYIYYLQQVKIEGNKDLSQSVMLTWKIKHPFGHVTLGAVQLFKMPEISVEQLSVRFIEPLIFSLAVERRRHKQAANMAAKNSDQLLEDNQQLLNQLQLIAESRQRDDQRLIARFIKVLNTKKLQLADTKHKLSELKKHQQHNNLSMSIIGEKEENVLTEIGHHSCGLESEKTKSNIVLDEEQTTVKKSVVNRKRKCLIQYDHINLCPISSEEDNKRTDNDAILQHTNRQLQKQELSEINTINRVSTDENVTVDLEAATVPSIDVNMSDNNSCFTCDTQIDDIPLEENVPNQLNSIKPMTITTLSNVPTMSLNHDSNHKISKKKIILDDLWSGIL